MARKLKKIIVPDSQGNPVEYEIGGVDADTASAGQVLTADGNGGTSWGDVATSGSGVTTDVRSAIYALLSNTAFLDDDGSVSTYLRTLKAWAETVTGITLNLTTLSITRNGTSQLLATTTPAGGAVSWSTSDGSVATVSNTGLVQGVGNGSCAITATSGDFSATCDVTVTGFATLTSINAVYTQSGTVYDDADLSDLKADLVVTATYSDSSTAIIGNDAYVLSGTLTAGTSTILVTYGGQVDTFTVNVASTAPLYPLTNGSFTFTNGQYSGVLTISNNNHISSTITDTSGSINRYADLSDLTANNESMYGGKNNHKVVGTTIFTLHEGDVVQIIGSNFEMYDGNGNAFTPTSAKPGIALCLMQNTNSSTSVNVSQSLNSGQCYLKTQAGYEFTCDADYDINEIALYYGYAGQNFACSADVKVFVNGSRYI